MTTFLLSSLIGFAAHAGNLDCRGMCVVLQYGEIARSEIAATPREYKSSIRLVKVMGNGPLFGDSVEQLQANCEELSQDVTWYKPTGEMVYPLVVKSIEVDDSDDVKAVKSMKPLKQCEPYSQESQDFQYFIDLGRR